MDIFYTNKTLYVNSNEELDAASALKMKRRILKILEDYGIDNVELSLMNSTFESNEIVNSIVVESLQKYRAKVKIR